MFVRSRSSLTTIVPSSVAEYEDKAPRYLPKGVRAYPTITALDMPMTKAVSNMNGAILTPDYSISFQH
jgi:hypothetical protein